MQRLGLAPAAPGGGVMTSLLERDAAWCSANVGKSLGELPERPADNRCELCGCVRMRKLRPDFDPHLQRLGFSPDQCFRGWVCGACESLLKWLERVGEEKALAYAEYCVANGKPLRPRPLDGLCYLCEEPTRNLHNDHDHKVVEALGLTLPESRRDWLCTRCNTIMIARVDAIGPTKLREYLGRPRTPENLNLRPKR
jgi:Recombination endonuclease VII